MPNWLGRLLCWLNRFSPRLADDVRGPLWVDLTRHTLSVRTYRFGAAAQAAMPT